MSKVIFVDTSAWIMLLNASEVHHNDAVAFYNKLEHVNLVLSNYIISETYTWLRRKSGYKAAQLFLQTIKRKQELKQVEVIYSDAGLELQAARLLEKYCDHSFSFADAVSFCIMENHGMDEAFTYDQHFAIAGFKVRGKS